MICQLVGKIERKIVPKILDFVKVGKRWFWIWRATRRTAHSLFMNNTAATLSIFFFYSFIFWNESIDPVISCFLFLSIYKLDKEKWSIMRKGWLFWRKPCPNMGNWALPSCFFCSVLGPLLLEPISRPMLSIMCKYI